jgi:hypothetical protein
MSEINPHESDLVLGGQNPPPVNAAILGGLAGVKQRLESESIPERLCALTNAVQYGNDGIIFAIQALTDIDIDVQYLASKLLRYQFGIAGEKALVDFVSLKYIGYYYATVPQESNRKRYIHEVGILNPEDITYIVEINNSVENINGMSNIEYLIKDPNISNLRSLVIEVDSLLHKGIGSANSIVELISPILIDNVTPNLKYIGICYKCHENTYKIDKEISHKEITTLYTLIMSTPVIENLKYLTLVVGTTEYGEYLSEENITSFKKLAPDEPPINFVKGVKEQMEKAIVSMFS